MRARNSWRVFVLLCAVAKAACAQTSPIENAAQFLKNGDTAQAEVEARKALHTPATRPLALAMLGTIRLQQGNTAESVKLLEQAAQPPDQGIVKEGLRSPRLLGHDST